MYNFSKSFLCHLLLASNFFWTKEVLHLHVMGVHFHGMYFFIIQYSPCYSYMKQCTTGHNGMKKLLKTVMCISSMSRSQACCHLISLLVILTKPCLMSHCLSKSETGKKMGYIFNTQKHKQLQMLSIIPLSPSVCNYPCFPVLSKCTLLGSYFLNGYLKALILGDYFKMWHRGLWPLPC